MRDVGILARYLWRGVCFSEVSLAREAWLDEMKRREELELCLAAKEAKISEGGNLKTEVHAGKAQIAEMEGEVSKMRKELADLQSRPKDRYVESLKGGSGIQRGGRLLEEQAAEGGGVVWGG